MAKKPKEKQPPLPTPPSASSSSSSSSSSSDEEDSPPPAISPVKKPPTVSSTEALQKHPEPSTKSIASEEEEEEEDGSDSEDESTDEESSDAAVAEANPPPQPRDSRTTDGKQGLNNSHSSDTESEEGEEDEEEVDSSSESEPPPPPPPPPPQEAAANAEVKKAATTVSGSDSASEDESESSSSDSDKTAPPPPPPPPPPPTRGSSRSTADPSLKPLSSKPMDKSPISRKRSAPLPPAQVSKRRRTADVVGAERGQEKKEFNRRIWSKTDELALLQCILDHQNEHHQGASAQVQVESLLKSVNDSLSSSVTVTQMNDKTRRLKLKYNTTVKKVKGAHNPKFSNDHEAACFDLSRKIWGASKEEPGASVNNLKMEKVKENIKVEKGKANHLAVEYPFLRWHAKNDHADIALEVHSHIPTAEATKLEGSCKKLEMTEIQLHMQKTKLLSSSLKLIEDAIAKL